MRHQHERLSRREAILGIGGAVVGVGLGWGCERPQRAQVSLDAGHVAAPPQADLALVGEDMAPSSAPAKRAKIALVKSSDRAEGIKRAVALLGLSSFDSQPTFLKPNFNSEHANPGSTHEQTLLAMLEVLGELNAGPITLGDRSGMGDTRQVMKDKAIFALAKKHGFNAMVFDELKAAQWVGFKPEQTSWQRGFYMPKPFMESPRKVLTCCLKTHQYGGHFTLSLKNSVGLAARLLPGASYNYMRELHRASAQRTMIAELNTAYQPDLIVLDGVEAFVNGGPHEGDRERADLILAGTDRVALDVLGVAMLRRLGTTKEVSEGPIFALEQIKRAVALGVGIGHIQELEILTDDQPSKALADALIAQINASG